MDSFGQKALAGFKARLCAQPDEQRLDRINIEKAPCSGSE